MFTRPASSPDSARTGLERITGFINWHRNRRKHLLVNTLDLLLSDIRTKQPDHLMITGDLVNLATSIEIRLAGEWLRSIGDPLDTTVVPGNHDAYVPGAHDRSVREWYPFIAADNDPNDWSDEDHIFPPIAAADQSPSSAALPQMRPCPFPPADYSAAGKPAKRQSPA